MRKTSRALMAMALAGATVGLSVSFAAPASACTGDVCDGFCVTYDKLPPAVQEKVFHSDSCPVR